jgi:8-oxo-dGTP pyrophosphatase MutT (NUDIX family)
MTPNPPQARPSATVILHRPSADGDVEVYLLRRSPRSRFMAGAYVFPGGVLDADDDDAQWGRLVDLPPAETDRRFGWPQSDAAAGPLAYLVAGVRETFEEAGVLLARRADGLPPSEEAVAAFQTDQGRSAGGFADWIAAGGWQLTLSGLYRWSHWVTPLAMRSRYDTRFFAAAMPMDQVCRPDPRETPEGTWTTPRAALTANAEGRLPLSPPTLVTLGQLLAFADTDALEAELAQRHWGRPIMPRRMSVGEEAVIVEPWDPRYDDPTLVPVPGQVLAVGQPFSRLWYHEGRWLPVKAVD